MESFYKNSGVDIERAETAVSDTIKKFGVIPGYASSLDLEKGAYAFTCDGVGTKTVLTSYFKKDDIAGMDLVAANFNDLSAYGARPEYIMCCLSYGRLDPSVNSRITDGIMRYTCKQGARLLGGETAELPGLLETGTYDLSGFAWGRRVYDFSPERTVPGDIILALGSSGFHCNGYSLLRNIFSYDDIEKNVGEFLAPSALYSSITDGPNQKTVAKYVKNCANVTGGGIRRALARLCGKGRQAQTKNIFPESEIYRNILEKGVSVKEIEGVFNCGVGFIIAADKSGKDEIAELFNAEEIGRII